MTGRGKIEASGVEALLLLLRFHHIVADLAQFLHQFGGTFGVAEILRCAKTLKLKARAADTRWERLTSTSLPAVARFADRPAGGFDLRSRAQGARRVVGLDPARAAGRAGRREAGECGRRPLERTAGPGAHLCGAHLARRDTHVDREQMGRPRAPHGGDGRGQDRRRRIVEYLLSPLLRVKQESLRER